MSDFTSPIEKDPELLKKYGLFFAYLGTIEFLMEELIKIKGGLKQADKRMLDKLLSGKTLGPKISLLADHIPQTLKEGLETLNKERVILAHGSITNRILENNTINYAEVLIEHKNKSRELTIDYLEEANQLAKTVCILLATDFRNSFKK